MAVLIFVLLLLLLVVVVVVVVVVVSCYLEASHSPPCSADVRNKWNCNSTPPIYLQDLNRGKFICTNASSTEVLFRSLQCSVVINTFRPLIWRCKHAFVVAGITKYGRALKNTIFKLFSEAKREEGDGTALT